MEANESPAAIASAGSLVQNEPSTAQKSAREKPPLEEATGVPSFANSVTTHALGGAAASVVRPHWRINDLGQVQRSLDGEPWQTVLAGDAPHIHVLSIAGGEVWAGGEQSRVYRSADNGNTWIPVTLPEKNGTDHVILHVRFVSPQEIHIESADGTAWTSQDGGATWN